MSKVSACGEEQAFENKYLASFEGQTLDTQCELKQELTFKGKIICQI